MKHAPGEPPRLSPARQCGQALTMVLVLLAIGGLTIAVNLNYATTSLTESRVIEDKIKATYAAGAGVDAVLWSLGKGIQPPVTLPEYLNDMAVNMTTDNMGTRVFSFGGASEYGGTHPGALSLTSELTPSGPDLYTYAINIDRDTTANLHLEEVGARLPVGYTYAGNAARSDSGTIDEEHPTVVNPSQSLDTSGAVLLRFLWSGSNQPLADNFTVEFDLEGTGPTEGVYAWTVATPSNSYGLYGDFSGTWYRVTSTASRPSDNSTVATVVAETMKIEGVSVPVLSWSTSR